MRLLKIIGAFAVCLMFSSSLISSCCSVNAVTDEELAVKDKLLELIGDVFGLDLSKYNITDEGSTTRYDYGGVKVEVYRFGLVDAKGGYVTVVGQFYNGFPHWINISPREGTLYYTINPPKSSVRDMKSLFERYWVFAQKYDIVTVNESLATGLLDKAPRSLPKDNTSPAKVSLDNLTLYVQQNSFSFVYTNEDVDAPNKSWSISFTDDKITFADTFGLYSVYSLEVFSKEEITSYAFELAKKYGETLFAHADVKPDWSNIQSEVSLSMISGQRDNNALNNRFFDADVGTSYNVNRDMFMLYPFWTAKFYFNQPIDNVWGIQVGIWGDTKEAAYCYEFGAGNISQPSGKSSLSPKFAVISAFIIVTLIALFIVTYFKVIRKKKGL